MGIGSSSSPRMTEFVANRAGVTGTQVDDRNGVTKSGVASTCELCKVVTLRPSRIGHSLHGLSGAGVSLDGEFSS